MCGLATFCVISIRRLIGLAGEVNPGCEGELCPCRCVGWADRGLYCCEIMFILAYCGLCAQRTDRAWFVLPSVASVPRFNIIFTHQPRMFVRKMSHAAARQKGGLPDD